jgi:hypothetical protein
MKKSILTIHKESNRSKYNKFERTKFPNADKEYDKRNDGWRRIK